MNTYTMSISYHLQLSSNIFLILIGLLVANGHSEKLFRKGIKVPVLTLADIISTHTVPSEIECSFNCLKEQTCVGFKYKYDTNSPSVNCLLSNTTGKNNLAIYNDQGWVFFIDVNENIECKNAVGLGMENGKISDNQITASSEYDVTTGAPNARLNFRARDGLAGAWSPRASDQSQWLQVDFQRFIKITGISTQGREGCVCNQFVKSYTISFSDDGNKFQSHKPGGVLKVFGANSDINSIVNHVFTTSIVARLIRIHPRAWNNYISMRVEFYGC